jgi:hypothetical protein
VPDPDAPDLEELYDEHTLAALDRAGRGAGHEPWRTASRRPRLAGALLSATALALQDVFDPAPDGDAVVELRPDAIDPDHHQWVTFVFVPGSPRASRLIIRPWLAQSA